MEEYRRTRLTPRSSLQHFRPVSVGHVLRPLDGNDDLLDEMLNES
jgi:hypothetical protein